MKYFMLSLCLFANLSSAEVIIDHRDRRLDDLAQNSNANVLIQINEDIVLDGKGTNLGFIDGKAIVARYINDYMKGCEIGFMRHTTGPKITIKKGTVLKFSSYVKASATGEDEMEIRQDGSWGFFGLNATPKYYKMVASEETQDLIPAISGIYGLRGMNCQSNNGDGYDIMYVKDLEEIFGDAATVTVNF